jgi:beta-N-acetylhexosaminidase
MRILKFNFVLAIVLIFTGSLRSQITPDSIMKDMTLREKIAQMIITNSDGFNYDESSQEFSRLRDLIVNKKVGGVIFFKGMSLEQAKFTNRLQNLSEIPLLISADYERGTSMRLVDGSLFPNNMAIGAARNPQLAYKMGLLIAKECRAIGVHQNYSPVMDVNNNPDNPIINVRSFGEDPLLVSEMGDNMIKGLQEGGVIATAKHFPGHGDTDIDSHNDLPVIPYDMERLNKIELVPFKSAIQSGVGSVMIAHLSFPSLEKNPKVPASLSPAIVDGLLKNDLKFNGLIVTDALNMSGVTKNFSAGEIAVRCVKAGIDLILMDTDERVAIDAIEESVKTGDIKEERIDESCRKILYNKIRLGLFSDKLVNENLVSVNVNTPEEKALSQKIADESITLVKDDFDINQSASVNIISVNTIKDSKSHEIFNKEFSEAFTEKNIIFPQQNIQEITRETVIVPIFSKVLYKSGTAGIPQEYLSMINSLVQNNNKVIVISFGNPYLLKDFPEVSGYLCAYGDSETSIIAAVKVLKGIIPAKGKLPVTISEKYKFGFGINKILK